MSTRATVALFALFAALVAAYLVTDVREQRKVRQAFEAKRLFDFAASDVTTMSIMQQGASPVEAVRVRSGGWRLAGPHAHAPANSPLWDQLAELVATTTNERDVARAPKDEAVFELDTPRLTLIVGTREGTMLEMAFGALDPTQRHRYTQLSGDAVFLTHAELFSRLNRGLLDLRDRRIFTGLDDGITRIDYERMPVEAEEDSHLEDNIARAMTAIDETYTRSESGEWRISSPGDALAQQRRLGLLEKALQTLEGREYIDEPENLADYGLKSPFARLTVYGKDGAAQTLLFGWRTEDPENAGFYVKRSEARPVAVIDARLVLSIMPSEPNAYREKLLFTNEAAHLKTVRYRDTAGAFLLENHAAKGWQLVEPPAPETDQAAVSTYLSVLKSIEGDSFPENVTGIGFDPARIALDFTFDDERLDTRIEIGGPVPDSNPVEMYARQDFGALTTISFEEFQLLSASPFDFRVKTLFAFDRSLVDEVGLAVDGNRYRFVQRGARWSVVEPQGAQLDAQSDLNTFLDTLSRTAVSGMADPKPDSDIMGFDEPAIEVVIRLNGATPPTLGPIRVGNLKAEASRDRFVTIAGREEVYFVDQALVDAAHACISTIRADQN